MTETNELSLTDQDREDLAQLHEEQPAPSVNLLAAWRQILASGHTVRDEPVSMTTAGRLLAMWPKLEYADVDTFNQVYHDLVEELEGELLTLLAEHPEATGFLGEDDGTENGQQYFDILVRWHRALDQREADWRASQPDAAVHAAVLTSVRDFFFGDMGIVNHLESISYDLDAAAFFAAVAQEEEGQ